MFKKLLSDVVAGLITALFCIPEGLAYAQLAGVNPIYGLYSGMVPTFLASLTTSTCLMISTLTSAIALSTRSALDLSGFEDARALFPLTFLAGIFMITLGVLRLGKIVNFVSNAVMTGFVMGASFLIFAGQLGHLSGYKMTEASKVEQLFDWMTHVNRWDVTTTTVGVISILLTLSLKRIPHLKHISNVITLLIGTLFVFGFGLRVTLVRDVATIPSSFPAATLPDLTVTPHLVLGALSVALVALVQGAGISAAIPNPDGRPPRASRDFLSQGLGNLCGSFFQSLCTGGSLSLTGVSVEAGARSRFAGVLTALFLTTMVLLAADLIAYIPITCIAAILCVVAIKIILRLIPDAVLITKTSIESGLVMGLTFLSALFIPLQWTIFLGAFLSFAFYLYTSSNQIKLYQLIPTKTGEFEEKPVPKKIPSQALTILDYEGNGFFGEIPAIKELLPPINEVKKAVLIFRMRGAEDAHSTFLKWLCTFIHTFQKNGNLFLLEGVDPKLLPRLKKAGILNYLKQEHLFPAEPILLKELKKAVNYAQSFLDDNIKSPL